MSSVIGASSCRRPISTRRPRSSASARPTLVRPSDRHARESGHPVTEVTRYWVCLAKLRNDPSCFGERLREQGLDRRFVLELDGDGEGTGAEFELTERRAVL